jgi:hypothetical protein
VGVVFSDLSAVWLCDETDATNFVHRFAVFAPTA